MSENDDRSEFVQELEQVCRSFLEKGETEVMAKDVGRHIDSADNTQIGSILWYNTASDGELSGQMNDVDVTVIGKQNGAKVYRLKWKNDQ